MARPSKQKFDPSAQQSQQRIIGGKAQVKSDLFKLEISPCMVNKSYNDIPDLYEQEHIHWFHTYDSDGKKHTRSIAVAGHFHVIEYEQTANENEPVKILSVSGPMHEVKRKIKGRWVKVTEAVSSSLEDDHTHEITYKKTDIVEIRSQSPNAINIVAAEAQKTAPIPGISSF